MESATNTFHLALITGATGGLGFAFARSLAKRNINLILTGRNQNKLDEIKKTLEDNYRINVTIFTADISQSAGLQMLEKFIDDQECPDLFIHCAGSAIFGEFKNTAMDLHLESTALNVSSAVGLNHLMIEKMLGANGGNIINVTSSFAFGIVPKWSIYAASKAFLFSFSRSLREELKNSNIAVSVLCPGAIDTGFDKSAGYTSQVTGSKKLSPEYIAEYTLAHIKDSVILPELKSRIFYYLFNKLPDLILKFIRSGKY